jgi:hypothetical protein
MLNAPQQICSAFAVTRVDVDDLNAVGTRMRPYVEDARDDDAVEIGADMHQILDRHAETRHGVAERDRIAVERRKLSKPGK